MPASRRNINVQHGTYAHRGRLRHQTARSTSTEKRPETEGRGSKSEDTEKTNGTPAGNRFAALSHTEPVPGVDLERGTQPRSTDFTFRCKKPSPTADGTAVASSAQQPSSTHVKNMVSVTQPVPLLSPREQSDSVLTQALLAELRITALSLESDSSRGPATSFETTLSEPSSLLPQSSIYKPHPAVSIESWSPVNNVPSTESPQPREPQIGILHPILPSSSSLMTKDPLRPPRSLILPKPTVNLPPTIDTIPNSQIAAARTLVPVSDPLAHTGTSAEGRTSAMAAANTAETSREPLEAISKPAEPFGSKSAQAPSASPSKRSKESSVDEMNEGGSDGEWEWIE